jgi:glucosamine-6-phosphate deaminase
MEVIVKEDYAAMSRLAAEMIAQLIRSKPRAVLGLATGSTPLGTYKELTRMHKEDGLDFGQVVTFNLDEYVGLPAAHAQSYRSFMNENLFKRINVRPENTNLPDGLASDITAGCIAYEARIREFGGIDLQLLGIGSNGHIAFNEPGSSLGSRTRVKTLTEKTRKDNSRFFASMDEVPKYAVTMGIGTIMEARRVVLLANKESKADAVATAVEGPVTAMCPASALQMHPQVTVIVDRAAAARLKGQYLSEPQRLIQPG